MHGVIKMDDNRTPRTSISLSLSPRTLHGQFATRSFSAGMDRNDFDDRKSKKKTKKTWTQFITTKRYYAMRGHVIDTIHIKIF